MHNVFRWWSPESPTQPDPLWVNPHIIDTDFDVKSLPWYKPGRVRVDRELQHQANIARLYLLHAHGGWWVDQDVKILCPLEALPFPMTATHRHFRCNSVMGFPAGFPALMDALDAIAAAPPSDRRAVSVSGERLLSRVLSDTVARVPSPKSPSGRTSGAPEWMEHRYDTSSVRFRGPEAR